MEVAIIGGGPAGVAVARALAAEKKGWHITIYERQPVAGGVWNLVGEGPMYEDLETNVPKDLMAFRDFPLDADLPTYVPRQQVAAYFQKVARSVAQNEAIDVQYNAAVVDVTKDGAKWSLTLRDGTVHKADYVLVASGHHEHACFPRIPGLAAFQAAHPDRVKHSLQYVEPSPHTGRRVLIIGNAATAIDLTIQVLRVTDAVTVSRRTESKADALFQGASDVTLKPEPVRVDAETGEVHYADGTHGFYDDILVATGYEYRYPFLDAFNARQEHPFLAPPEYDRLQHLHKYIFYIDDPTLAFVAVNLMVVPIPWIESQAAVVARVWAGRLRLPGTQEMLALDEQVVAERGSDKGYLTLNYPEDVDYMSQYSSWVDSAGADGGFSAEKWGPDKIERRAKALPDRAAALMRKMAESRAQRQARAAQ